MDDATSHHGFITFAVCASEVCFLCTTPQPNSSPFPFFCEQATSLYRDQVLVIKPRDLDFDQSYRVRRSH
ncbi:hypothetical protein H2248_010308 [Termitomyces sp. 'cryptogamus']|nr:hypothetical protein H2248_010308 [Termitomyces sp. 'cryptogamus']